MGWGLTNKYEGDSKSDDLMFTWLKVLNQESCKEKVDREFGSYDLIKYDPKSFCTMAEKKDFCIGDSGNGVVMRSGTDLVLIGILSYGHTMCASYLVGQ